MQDIENLKLAGLDGREARIKLVQDIASAEDISGAASALKEYFEAYNTQLMSVKFFDSAEPGNAIRPFAAYSQAALKVAKQIQVQGGCPFTKEAMRRLSAFDYHSLDRSKYQTFLDRRFFAEIDKAGHSHIAIVPVMLGRAVALFSVGLYDQPFKGELRELVVESISQSMPAFIDRFQGIKTMFEKKHLTSIERSVLQQVCEGFEPKEIQTSIGLSEFTVSLLMQSASKKLEVPNSQTLIYRALALGEIAQPPAMQSFETGPMGH